MSLPKHLVAAPAALIRAAAGSDEVDRSFTMRVSPCLYIAVDVDGLASGPGLAIEIGNLCALRSFVHLPRGIKVGDAGNRRIGVRGPCTGTNRVVPPP